LSEVGVQSEPGKVGKSENGGMIDKKTALPTG
jgi:hypothetical protein